MREIVHIQTGQCGNQIGAKVSFYMFSAGCWEKDVERISFALMPLCLYRTYRTPCSPSPPIGIGMRCLLIAGWLCQKSTNLLVNRERTSTVLLVLPPPRPACHHSSGTEASQVYGSGYDRWQYVHTKLIWTVYKHSCPWNISRNGLSLTAIFRSLPVTSVPPLAAGCGGMAVPPLAGQPMEPTSARNRRRLVMVTAKQRRADEYLLSIWVERLNATNLTVNSEE